MKKMLMCMCLLLSSAGILFAQDYQLLGSNKTEHEDPPYKEYDFTIEGNIDVEIELVITDETEYKSLSVFEDFRRQALFDYLYTINKTDDSRWSDTERIEILVGLITNEENIEDEVRSFIENHPEINDPEKIGLPLLSILECKIEVEGEISLNVDDFVLVFYDDGNIIRRTPIAVDVHNKNRGIVRLLDTLDFNRRRKDKFDFIYNNNYGSYPAAIEYKGETVCILAHRRKHDFYEDFMNLYQ